MNNKVSIDLTGDPRELNESLKRSESLITQYGKKIQRIMETVGKAISSALSFAAKSVTNAAVGFKNLLFLLVDLGKSAGVLNTQVSSLNSLFQNGIIAVTEYTNNLFNTWQTQKDLALSVQLTGKHAGYTSEQMERYAEHLEKVTRFSKEASMGAQMILTHFRDIRGEHFLKATKAAQDMARALRIDLSSAANEVGNALHNPLEAMDQLASRNIFFTRKEKETILTMLEANRVVDAQTIVLKKLNDAFGGAARKEMGDFSAKLEQIRNRLYRIAQALAEHVINKINKMIGVTADGTSRLEAYISKIESFVPAIAGLIDTGIKKMQEWADVIKDKLIVAFNFFTKVAITGIAVIQTAFQNLTKIVRLVTANFELQLEKLKQTWLTVWTRVIPASIRYLERIFKEVTEVKIPNFFTRMMQKVLTIMTKGLISGVIKLLDFATGRWAAVLAARGTLIGAKLMLRFMKAAIETPLKMGGVYAKVFSTIFGLAGLSIEKIGEDIGRRLAEAEARDAEEKSKSFKNNYGADSIENFFKYLLPERASKNDLTAPNFAAMFNRAETAQEIALRKEIDGLKASIAKDFESNKEVTTGKAEELKKKVGELLAEQERANKEFQDKFGKEAKEPELTFDNQHVYDRDEAVRAKERAKEEEERRRKLEEKELKKGKDDIPDAVHGLEEFWYKQNSPTEENTKAVKENTAEIRAYNEAIRQDKAAHENQNQQPMRKDDWGHAIVGFNAFLFNVPKNMKKVELDRKKQEREDEQFRKRTETRRRNDLLFRGRQAKPAIREQNKFGINTEQQRRQAQMILDAQIRRGQEEKAAKERMKEILERRREAQKERVNKSRKEVEGIKGKRKDEQADFDKRVKDLLDETKEMNKNTKDVADSLKNVGAI